jgi:hypothetical protein
MSRGCWKTELDVVGWRRKRREFYISPSVSLPLPSLSSELWNMYVGGAGEGLDTPSSPPPMPGLNRELRNRGQAWAPKCSDLSPYLCSPRYPWPGWGWEVLEDLRKLRCSALGKGCRGDCPGAPGAGDLMAICLEES